MKLMLVLLVTIFSQTSFADLKCTLAGCDCKATPCRDLDSSVINEQQYVMLQNLSDPECIQLVKDLKVKYGCDSRVTDRRGGFGMLMTNCLLHESASQCPGGKGEKIGPFYICKKGDGANSATSDSSKKEEPKKLGAMH